MIGGERKLERVYGLNHQVELNLVVECFAGRKREDGSDDPMVGSWTWMQKMRFLYCLEGT